MVASWIQRTRTNNKTRRVGVEVVIAFDAEAAPFPVFFFKTNEMAPLTWWKGLKRGIIFQKG